MIYVNKMYCKKGCDIEYISETDDKDFKKELKCPICSRKLYVNEEDSYIIKSVYKALPKREKNRTSQKTRRSKRKN